MEASEYREKIKIERTHIIRVFAQEQLVNGVGLLFFKLIWRDVHFNEATSQPQGESH